MPYKIQHLGLGGILDQAIAITRDHFLLLFSIMLMLVIPYNLIMGFTMISVFPETSMFPTEEENAEMMAAMIRYWPLFAVNVLLTMGVIYPLANAAVTWAVARVYLGQPATALGAMKETFRRILPLLWTAILMNIVIIIGLALCVLPGLVAMFLFVLSPHAVMIEGLSGIPALKRSVKLVFSNFATFFALGLVLFVIFVAVGLVGAFIPQEHVRLIAQTLAQAVATMVNAAAWVVYYFSARCAVENFDLHYLAQSIGVPAAEGELLPAR